MEPVTLEQMLAARDARQERITSELHHAPLISFSMNIPGPVKDSPLIRRSFHEGQRRLEAALGEKLTLIDGLEAVTGCEALYAAVGDALKIKSICAAIEDTDDLGRLFDMDVICADGSKIDRAALQLSERGCMVCSAPGRGCAARRLHTVEELQKETSRRMEAFFTEYDRKAIERLATESLLEEVRTTPKPGLVDRANSGSHADMDLPLFEKSAAALTPYWGECFTIGRETADLPPEETFRRLRSAGLAAEKVMFAATAGINTHKGAIFLLGALCGAAGRLWSADAPCYSAAALCKECSAMTEKPLRDELNRLTEATTAGEQLYLSGGARGARGEVMDGLPSVLHTALPALRRAIDAGCGRERAASIALLHLVALGQDTNLYKRGGKDGAVWAATAAKKLLEEAEIPSPEQISDLDSQFIERNLSPGGCADLLASALFLYDTEHER